MNGKNQQGNETCLTELGKLSKKWKNVEPSQTQTTEGLSAGESRRPVWYEVATEIFMEMRHQIGVSSMHEFLRPP